MSKRGNRSRLTIRNTALELKKAGASYADIGRALGITGVSAQTLVRTALSQLDRESFDLRGFRRLSLERFDRLLRAVWPKAMEGDCEAARTCAYIERQRNELLGLNAPKQLDIGVAALKIVWSPPPQTERNEGASSASTFDSSVESTSDAPSALPALPAPPTE